MKFELVFKTAKENFPGDYPTHFLDYDALMQIINLAKIPGTKGRPVHWGKMEAPNGKALFFKVLEHNLHQINTHFNKVADHIMQQWRVVMKMEAPNTPDAPPVMESKVANAARHCFQYAKMNEGALKRILGEFDDALKSKEGTHFLEDVEGRRHFEKAEFMHSAKVEEVRAIFRLYDIYHEEGKVEEKKMKDGAIAMEIFDCSFSQNWVPYLDDMNPYCPSCTKPMEGPVGLKCGHIICGPCLNHMCHPVAVKIHPSIAGGGLNLKMDQLKLTPFSAVCPKCRLLGAAETTVTLTALGMLIKETKEKRLKQEREKEREKKKKEQEERAKQLERHSAQSKGSAASVYTMGVPGSKPAKSKASVTSGPFMPVVFPK